MIQYPYDKVQLESSAILHFISKKESFGRMEAKWVESVAWR
jgi:hypothetical protein